MIRYLILIAVVFGGVLWFAAGHMDPGSFAAWALMLAITAGVVIQQLRRQRVTRA